MAEQINRQLRMRIACRRDERVKIIKIILKFVDVEPLALRLPTPAKVESIDREPVRRELLARQQNITAVSVKPMDQYHHSTRRTRSLPLASVYTQSTYTRKRRLFHLLPPEKF